MKKITINIWGMHCASCSAVIERTISKIKWVEKATVSLAENTATVSFDSHEVTEKDIHDMIKRQGYKVLKDNEDESKWLLRYYRWWFWVSLVLTIPVAITMFIKVPHIFALDTFFMLAALLVVFGAWWNFHKWFFTKIIYGQMNMDALISISTLIAIIYSWYAYYNIYWTENIIHFYHFLEGAQFIITFILLGKYLELKSKWSASRAIASLMQLQAKQATVIRDGKEKKIDIDDIVIDDIVIVRAGEKIPVDGIVIEWSCDVDEAMLTGESLPVNKEKDNEVYSGTIVNNGSLRIRVTKTSEQTMLAGIMQSVRDAQASKPPIQHLVDNISRIFVPCILLIAALAYLLHSQWMMMRLYEIMGTEIHDLTAHALLVAVATIVIACPCAMWLATPMAITVASGTGAKRWILIKTWDVLETSKAVSMVLFDKTGTLTKGKPIVTDIINYSQKNEKELLTMIQGMVRESHHPLSRSLIDNELRINQSDYTQVREHRGKWMTAQYHNNKIWYGNISLVKNMNVEISKNIQKNVINLQNGWKTVNYIIYKNAVIWLIAVRDNPKTSAKEAMRQLHSQWIETMMISGDNERTVGAVAKEIGIDTYHAWVHPDQKAELVKKAQEKWHIVAFVGDGINDAPALAQANVGIAIGHGTDIAIETAQMVVVSGDPLRVAQAIQLARKTYNIIRQNLFRAFAYNTILVPVAALWLLMPWFASLAMSLSSVSVVVNSLRIKKAS